eukprot:snap_masked-scaffold_43-processed-gene-1.83-mRNA-1 protein AED:1.00 eAED:1.00 QI:0/0/0/0/1/1/2/0/1090
MDVFGEIDIKKNVQDVLTTLQQRLQTWEKLHDNLPIKSPTSIFIEINGMGTYEIFLHTIPSSRFAKQSKQPSCSNHIKIKTSLKAIEYIRSKKLQPWKALLLRKVTYTGPVSIRSLGFIAPLLKETAQEVFQNISEEKKLTEPSFSPAQSFIQRLMQVQSKVQTSPATPYIKLTNLVLSLQKQLKEKSSTEKLLSFEEPTKTSLFLLPFYLALIRPKALMFLVLIPSYVDHPYISSFALTTIFFGSFFSRLIQIYSVSFVTILSYFLVDKVTKSNQNALHILDSFFAPFLTTQLLSLRSVFAKFGQYLSTRADILPKQWSTPLSKLQDDMPTSSNSYVQEELAGVNVVNVDFKALASATIAQVHAAYTIDGQKVAVKVQHDHVKELIKKDLVAMRRIVGVVSWLNKKFEIVQVVFNSWEKVMLKELDFRIEGNNLTQVRKYLSNVGMISQSESSVLVPEALISTEKVLVMPFFEGFKITDQEKLELFYVDKKLLLELVVRAYSIQIFVQGSFNADPHAGNILVNICPKTGKVRPVLLDFGMVVELSEKEKTGYCELLVGIEQLSVSGLTKSIQKIGYENSQSFKKPERDLEFFAYLFRPTGSRKQSKAETKAFRKRRKQQRKEDVNKPEDEDLEGRYFKKFPESFVFLFRVLGLIRGLCAELDVEVDYIDIMSQYAKYSLLQKNLQSHLDVKIPSNEPILNKIIREQMHQEILQHPDSLVGYQAFALEKGKAILDIAEGEVSEMSNAKVCGKTTFPLFDISPMVLNLLVLELISEGKLNFSSKVNDFWNGFPNDSLKISHLLKNIEIPEVVPSFLSIEYLSDKNYLEKLVLENFPTELSFVEAKRLKKTVHTTSIILNIIFESIRNQTIVEYIESSYGFSFKPSEKRVELSHNLGSLLRSLASTQLNTPILPVETEAQNNTEEGEATGEDTEAMVEAEESPLQRNFGVPLDPSVLNYDKIAGIGCTGISLFSSSKELTLFVKSCFKRLSPDVTRKIFMSKTNNEANFLFGTRTWGLGFEALNLADDIKSRVIFFQGFGGSIFLILPNKGIFLSVLVNRITLDRTVTKKILDRILGRYGYDSSKLIADVSL